MPFRVSGAYEEYEHIELPTQSHITLGTSPRFCVSLAPDDVNPDNLQQPTKQTLYHRFANLNSNMFGIINMILIALSSIAMALMILVSDSDGSAHSNELWIRNVVIFVVSMVIVPVLIQFNIPLLHHRLYADYIHCTIFLSGIVCCGIMAFFVLSDSVTVTERQQEAFRIAQYVLIHMFIFNLCSRFWILWYWNKCGRLLSLWLLCLMGFLWSVLILSDHLRSELHLLRSWYCLLWIVVVTRLLIHCDDGLNHHRRLCMMVTVELMFMIIAVPLRFVVFHDIENVLKIMVFTINGLVVAASVQLLVVAVVLMQKEHSFYIPVLYRCCFQRGNITKIAWCFVCILTINLVIAQVIGMMLMFDSLSVVLSLFLSLNLSQCQRVW